MFTIFLALIVIVCFLLIVVIMVQNPKGGGLSSTLGGSQQLGGVQKTTDFLDKSTWTLGTILILLVLFSSLSFQDSSSNNMFKDVQATEKPAETQAPITETPAETTAPATQEAPATEEAAQ